MSDLDIKPPFLKSFGGSPGVDRLDRGADVLNTALPVNKVILTSITPTTSGVYTQTVQHKLGYRFLNKCRFTDTDGSDVSFGISDLSGTSMWLDDVTESTIALSIINGVSGTKYPVTIIAYINEMI